MGGRRCGHRDRIVYAGDNDGARGLVDADTEIADLQGRMPLPGFIDTHMHPASGADRPPVAVRFDPAVTFCGPGHYKPRETSIVGTAL